MAKLAGAVVCCDSVWARHGIPNAQNTRVNKVARREYQAIETEFLVVISFSLIMATLPPPPAAPTASAATSCPPPRAGSAAQTADPGAAPIEATRTAPKAASASRP